MSQQEATISAEPKQVNSTVSYSRLSVFEKCPRAYWHQYINHTAVTKPVEEALITGSLAHSLIELQLKDELSPADALSNLLPEWLEIQCQLPTEEQHPEGISLKKLEMYGRDMGKLLQRCSAAYTEYDAIRTKDGSVPKDPLNYPPGELSKALNAYGLNDVRMDIDLAAAQLNMNFERMSLGNIVAMAMSYAYNFNMPDWIEEVIAVEYDLAVGEEIDFEGKKWTGRIDKIIRGPKGAKSIIDHKSSKKAPLPVNVYYHPQLNLYTLFEFEKSGEFAQYIGIYHMGSGEFIMSKVSLDVAEEIYEFYADMQRRINSAGNAMEQFPKQLPTSFTTSCIRWSWKQEGVVDQVCPYIRHCWPKYAKQIKGELMNHLGKAPDEPASL